MRLAFFALLITGTLSLGVTVHDHVLSLADESFQDHCQSFLTHLPENIVVEHSTLVSDTTVDTDELIALIGLVANASLTRNELERGFYALKCKQKFSSVHMRTEQGDSGWKFDLTCTSVQTIGRISFKTNLSPSEKYRALYTSESGQPFNEAKHKQLLDHLRLALHKDGYFEHTITPLLTNQAATKEVNIRIEIASGKRFTLDGVSVKCILEPSDPSQEKHAQEVCVRMLEPSLRYEYYTHALMKEQLTLLYKHWQAEGYGHIAIEPRFTLNRKKHTINIHVLVSLANRKLYTFSGNQFFETSTLHETALLLGPSAPLLPPAVIAEDIMLLYRKSGFVEATVVCQEEHNAYAFDITEGPRCKLIDVTFEGVHALTPDAAKEYFAPALTNSYYDAVTIQECCDSIAQWYLSHGYWDISFDEESLLPGHRNEEKALVIRIQEGAQRYLLRVSIEGFPDAAEEEIFKKYENLMRPIPFDIHIIREQQQALTKYLHKKGYLYSLFKPELVQEPDGWVLMWRLSGYQEPIRFGKTIVLGSTYTVSRALLRELEYREGDLWNIDVLNRSISKLKALDLFESVSLQPIDLFKPEPYKTMALKAVEDDPFEIRARLGIGFISRNIEIRGGTTYRIGASFLWKSPSRQADLLRLDADVTRYTRDATLSYRMPWLWQFPIKTTLKAYASFYEQPFIIDSRDILYDAVHTGFSARFEGDYRFFDWGINTGVEWMKLEGVSRLRAEKLEFEPDLIDRFFPYLVCEPSVFFDYLDNKLQPTRGILSVISLRGMFPFTLCDAWYVKFLAEQSCFFPLHQNVVLAIRLRLGHIFHGKFERIMPTERFYLGGAFSLRGYEPDHAPPVNFYTDSEGHTHLVPIGGKSMVNVNIEVRFPIYRNIGGVLFTDMGALSKHGMPDIARRDILGASGFGLRYDTSVGSVRFDIGWKWRKRFENDRSFAWFLTLGQAF